MGFGVGGVDIKKKFTKKQRINKKTDCIYFLVKSGRRVRMQERDDHPSDFFYGFYELCSLGLTIVLVEDDEIGMAPPRTLALRVIAKLSRFFGGLPVGMCLGLLAGANYIRLNQASCIVATTNGMGMALAVAKALGLLKKPVVLIAMGLIPPFAGWWQKFLYRHLVQQIKIVSISKGETEYLKKMFPCLPISYVPFGVDQSYWVPNIQKKPEGSGYVLAIGNDLARDWQTLVNSWHPAFPMLKIVTSLTVPEYPKNIEVIKGDWRSQLLSDNQIRKFYQEALFVVVPLHETIQPSGQSVCLQAMACGRAVVMSEISGLWDRELIRDGENVLLVPPADADALGAALSRLISDAELRERIGRRGREIIESNFNTMAMAESLRHVLEKVVEA